MGRKSWMFGAAFAAILAPGGPAFSQEATENGAGEGEIVVTAQRREEVLQDVPLTVQVVRAEELRDRGVSDLMELQRVSPSMTVQNTASSVSPYLRGVGSTTAGPGQFGSVAIYQDGVYNAGLTSAAFELDSAEQVQVLSGPQGALYGRNATGGALVVTTHTPRAGDELDARLRLSHGSYNTQTYIGSISGSLGDRLAGSFSASRRLHDGYVENLNPAGTGPHNDDLNDLDSWSARGALTFEPTDRLLFTLRASHFEKEDRSGVGFQPVGLDLDFGGGLNGTQALYAGTLQAFGFTPLDAFNAANGLVFSNEVGATYDNQRNGFQNGILPGDGPAGSFNALDLDSVSLRGSYTFDNFELTSTTSYTEALSRASTGIINASPASYPPALAGGEIGFSGYFPSSDFQQDIQLTSIDSPIEWVAGLFYFDGEGDANLSADLPGGLSFISARSTWRAQSLAGYAQATVPLSDTWSATGGIRYTDETYELDDRIDPLNPTTTPGVTNQGNQEISSSATTYTARLQYDNGPFLAYAGIATGFKGAAFTASNPSSPGVDPEEITSFESGFKLEPVPGITINAAAFHYQYDNVHIAVTDVASGATVLVNGTSAELTGLEVQTSFDVTDWLTLRAGGLLLASEYESDVPSTATTGILFTGGKRLAGAPDGVVNLGADLSFPVANGEWGATIDATRNNGFFLDAENLVGTTGIEAGAFTTVDLSTYYEPAGGHWRLSVWGTNVTDEEYFTSTIIASSVLRTANAASPAVFGVTLELRN